MFVEEEYRFHFLFSAGDGVQVLTILGQGETVFVGDVFVGDVFVRDVFVGDVFVRDMFVRDVFVGDVFV